MNPFLEPYIPSGSTGFRLSDAERNDLAFSRYLVDCIRAIRGTDYGAVIIPTVRTVERRLLTQLPAVGRKVRTIGGFVHKCKRDPDYRERNFVGWPDITRTNFLSILAVLSEKRGAAGHNYMHYRDASWSLVLSAIVLDQLEQYAS